MTTITILSKQPPGGRCSLYMRYAEALRQALGYQPEVRYCDDSAVSTRPLPGPWSTCGAGAGRCRCWPVAASVGSACHDQGDAVRGVLGAMGTPPERARGAVRFSIGEPTTEDEIRQTADALIATWRSLTAP